MTNESITLLIFISQANQFSKMRVFLINLRKKNIFLYIKNGRWDVV